MKAILCSQYCGPDDLVLADVPDPVAGPGEAEIAIKSAALNFFDLLMIQGKYQIKPPFPFSPAAEVAGNTEEASLDQDPTRCEDEHAMLGAFRCHDEARQVGESLAHFGPGTLEFPIPFGQSRFGTAGLFRVGAKRHNALLYDAEGFLIECCLAFVEPCSVVDHP